VLPDAPTPNKPHHPYNHPPIHRVKTKHINLISARLSQNNQEWNNILHHTAVNFWIFTYTSKNNWK
jgi:hypothetical protein